MAVKSDWLAGFSHSSLLSTLIIPFSLINWLLMAWKNPIDQFWTCSVEPTLFLLYFLVQLGMGLPWTALSLFFVKTLVSNGFPLLL